MRINRRNFLKSALAAGALAALGPRPWIRRASAAPSTLAGPSGGAILLVLNGGARTQCVFNGTTPGGVNPFGALSGLPVPLSKVQQGSGLDRAAINASLNLLTTARHHNFTGNHDTGRVVACTGYEPQEARPGILSILNFAFSFRPIPCVNIGEDNPTTSVGSEISTTFSPIKINSPLDVQAIRDAVTAIEVSPAERERSGQLRDALQDRFLRTTKYREPADIPFFQRRALEIAAQFGDAALDIRDGGSLGRYRDGTLVTNAGLRASFGVSDSGGGNSTGAQAMLAVRLRQLGCAGITLSSPHNWDFHSGEDERLPVRSREVGQALAGLIEHLGRIPDLYDPAKSLLDTTVITVMTDFNRGNWSAGTGFNDTTGSDHLSGEAKTSTQCIPLIGGGLPGGRVFGEVTAAGAPAEGSPVCETRQVLATVLDLLGIAPERYFPGSVRPLTAELSA